MTTNKSGERIEEVRGQSLNYSTAHTEIITALTVVSPSGAVPQSS